MRPLARLASHDLVRSRPSNQHLEKGTARIRGWSALQANVAAYAQVKIRGLSFLAVALIQKLSHMLAYSSMNNCRKYKRKLR